MLIGQKDSPAAAVGRHFNFLLVRSFKRDQAILMGFWLAGNPADFYIFLPLSNKLKIVKEEKEKREKLKN